MKALPREELPKILAHICSRPFDDTAIEHYLKRSPTVHDFRNLFAAAVFFRVCSVAFQSAPERSTPDEDRTILAERFGAAREELDDLGSKFDGWLCIVEQFADRVPGFKWGTQRRHAAAGALSFLDAVDNFARAVQGLRFDPIAKPPAAAQS